MLKLDWAEPGDPPCYDTEASEQSRSPSQSRMALLLASSSWNLSGAITKRVISRRLNGLSKHTAPWWCAWPSTDGAPTGLRSPH